MFKSAQPLPAVPAVEIVMIEKQKYWGGGRLFTLQNCFYSSSFETRYDIFHSNLVMKTIYIKIKEK